MCLYWSSSRRHSVWPDGSQCAGVPLLPTSSSSSLTVSYAVPNTTRAGRTAFRHVIDLAFADDINLISSEFCYADLTLQALAASGREAGLGINGEKNEVLVVGDLAATFPVTGWGSAQTCAELQGLGVPDPKYSRRK